LFFGAGDEVGRRAGDLGDAPVDGDGLAKFDRADEHGGHNGHDHRKFDPGNAPAIAPVTADGGGDASRQVLQAGTKHDSSRLLR
jgi:hypothetical protein